MGVGELMFELRLFFRVPRSASGFDPRKVSDEYLHRR